MFRVNINIYCTFIHIPADNPKCTRRSAARVTTPTEERPKRDLPDKPDEHLYNELMYIRHEKDLEGKKIHINIMCNEICIRFLNCFIRV